MDDEDVMEVFGKLTDVEGAVGVGKVDGEIVVYVATPDAVARMETFLKEHDMANCRVAVV